MAVLGEPTIEQITVGELRSQLLGKGFVEYGAPGSYRCYMHPLKARATALNGQDSDLALGYQKRAVELALRRV